MRTKEEILISIEECMEEYVAPNVAQHGGQVNVIDFDMESGILSTQLSGSCSGCASSTATLKQGIESTLMHFVPEVKGVTGEDDPAFNDPYYTSDPFGDYNFDDNQ
jgi:Fe-S cluster biogenesis protein NfuA|tara:strand:- start:130 stop:447 length:318 start_codon:yes stop_codon:yes gene_type:complete